MLVTGESDDAWREIAHRVERFDADAGRAVHAALRRRDRPPTVQVVERAGSGGADVADALAESTGCTIGHVELDVPGRPDPVVDGDVVVHVMAVRNPPRAIHPVDRTLIGGVEAGQVVVVLTGTEGLDDPATAIGTVAEHLRLPVHTPTDGDAIAAAVTARLGSARRRRDDELARTVAGIAATPPARDVIEAALDVLPGRGAP